ncbi:MAG: hypothetical protein M1274_03625 [Actinobacteria bacterium]|nr:hypothetical protein [Actinomycetota bacterium]
MLKKLLILILGVLAVTLLMTTVALAASPQDIYKDYADNGKLDNSYTDAELRAYLNDATLHMYENATTINRLDNLVNETLTRETFPFTGFQLMIAGIVAVALVGGGVTLRRLTRPQKSKS